ncbi:MAG: hypothetical protein HDT44_12100 [Ruminococcaceae bacterium]|nr:hypothetical protein [Oscillospiraceae bacterium]
MIRPNKLFAQYIRSALAAAAAFSVLTGCSGKTDTAANGIRLIWSYSNVTDSGILYADDKERLNFLDYESMNTTVLCSKPNCAHNDSESCSSYGISNHPILYDNKLYYFDVESVVDKDGNYNDITTIYRSETDGTDRVPLYKAEGMYMAPFYRLLLKGDTAYFYMANLGNDMGNSTGYDIGYFCSYNIPSNKFKIIDKIYEGYHSGAWIYGAWNDKIFLTASYSKEKVDFPPGGDSEAFDKYQQAIKDATVDEYLVYDTQTGTLTQSELPVPVYAEEGVYTYEGESGLVLLSEKGEEMLLEGFEKDDGLCVINGILFNITKKKCVKLSEKGAVYSLNISGRQVVKAYYNGNYIVKEDIVEADGSISGTKYEKMSESQLIGERA